MARYWKLLAPGLFVWLLLTSPTFANELLLAFAGQSNADGRSVLAELPEFKNAGRVKRFDHLDSWGDAAEPWNTRNPASRYDNFRNFERSAASPILAFGDKLAGLRGDATINIVSVTRGGTGIDWYRPGHEARLFEESIDRIKLAANGKPLSGIVFWQGESDTMRDDLADEWPAKFAQWVSDIRQTLDAPTLPVVLVLLANDPNDPRFPAWQRLRQRQADMRLPANVAAVDISDLPASAIHYPTSTIVEAGRRAAVAMNTLIAKQP